MYKKAQGMASRAGTTVLGALIGAYAGYSWYWWQAAGAATAEDATWSLLVQVIGALVLFGGITGLGIFLAFFREKSSEYLIDMDTELRKVVWPAVQPLFDPKAEAWGSTYVVIVSTIFLTVLIWIVDWGLQLGISDGLLQILF